MTHDVIKEQRNSLTVELSFNHVLIKCCPGVFSGEPQKTGISFLPFYNPCSITITTKQLFENLFDLSPISVSFLCCAVG